MLRETRKRLNFTFAVVRTVCSMLSTLITLLLLYKMMHH